MASPASAIIAAGWTLAVPKDTDLAHVAGRYRQMLEGKPRVIVTKPGYAPIVVGGETGIDPDILIERAWEAICTVAPQILTPLSDIRKEG